MAEFMNKEWKLTDFSTKKWKRNKNMEMKMEFCKMEIEIEFFLAKVEIETEQHFLAKQMRKWNFSF
jgi:hypothetical protein